MPASLAGGALARPPDNRESLRDAGRRLLEQTRVSIGGPLRPPAAADAIDEGSYPELDLVAVVSNSLDPTRTAVERNSYAAEAARRKYIAWEEREFAFLKNAGPVRLEFWKILFAAKGGWSAYEADMHATNMPVPLASGLRLWVEFRSARASYTTESNSISKLMNTIRDMAAALNTLEDLFKKNSLEAEIKKLSETNLSMQKAWNTVSARVPWYYRTENVRKTALLQEPKLRPQEGVELRFFGGVGADRSGRNLTPPGDYQAAPRDVDIAALISTTKEVTMQCQESNNLVNEYKRDAAFCLRLTTGLTAAKERTATEEAARKAANAARLEEEKQKQRVGKEDSKAIKDATDAACKAQKLNASAAALAADAEKAQKEVGKIPGEIKQYMKALDGEGDSMPDGELDSLLVQKKRELDALLAEKKSIMVQKLEAANNALDEVEAAVRAARTEAAAAAKAATTANGFLVEVRAAVPVPSETEEQTRERVQRRTQLVQWTTDHTNAAKNAEDNARTAKKAAVDQLGIAVGSRNACSRELETVKTAVGRFVARKAASDAKKKQAGEKEEAKRRADEARAAKAAAKEKAKSEAALKQEERRGEREAAKELSTIQKVNLWKENHADEEDAAESLLLFTTEKETWSEERKKAAEGTPDGKSVVTLQQYMLNKGNKRRAMIDLVTNGSVLSKKIPMPYSRWQQRREEWPWHAVVVVGEIMGSAKGSNSVLDEIWEEVSYKAAVDMDLQGSVQMVATSSSEAMKEFVSDNFQVDGKGVDDVGSPLMKRFLVAMEELIRRSFPVTGGDVDKALNWLAECVFRMYCRAQDFLANPDDELGKESTFLDEEKAARISIPAKYPLTMRLALIRQENEMRLFLEWAREEALLRVTAMSGGFDEDAETGDAETGDAEMADYDDSLGTSSTPASKKRKAEGGAGGSSKGGRVAAIGSLYSMSDRSKSAQGPKYKDGTARFDWRDFESAKETWAASAAGWWSSDFTKFIKASEESLNSQLEGKDDVDLKGYDQNKAVVLKEYYSRTRDKEQLAQELDKYLDLETAVNDAERELADAEVELIRLEEARTGADPKKVDEATRKIDEATRKRDAASRAVDREKREAVHVILQKKRQKAKSDERDRQELARILAKDHTKKNELDDLTGQQRSKREREILEDARRRRKQEAVLKKRVQLAKQASDRRLAIRDKLGKELGVPPESVAETVVKMVDFDNERQRLAEALEEEYSRPGRKDNLELEKIHEDGDKTRTDPDADFNRQQIGRLFASSQTVDSILRAAVGLDTRTATREAKEGPVVFNRGYARYLLREHVEALKKAHGDWSNAAGDAKLKEERKDAKFCKPHAALGDVDTPEGVARVVELLLPFFESMCMYRQSVLAAKRALIIREIDMLKPSDDKADQFKEEVVRQKRRVDKLKKRLVGSKKGVLDESISADLGFLEDWELDGQRMIDAAAGRVRDPASNKPATDTAALVPSQPTFMPLRVFAPPRVGKSATALLVASLAKRLGMLVMYSVAPNKLTPIYELEQKLKNIGWKPPVADKSLKQSNLSLQFNAVRIDSAIKQELTYRSYADKGKDNVTKRVDMVLYSSEVDSDARRVGGLLAHLKLRGRPVFHIRDEAQSIAQQLNNEDDATHSTDVPSPPTLQYLRAFYGNIYGLNCHVTATHFPTLLEEGTDMWGYIGTAQQNSNAGMPPASREGVIRKFPATHVLPRLLPALLPTIPVGYVGVEHMRTFRNPESSETIRAAKKALDTARQDAADEKQTALAAVEKSAEMTLYAGRVVGKNEDGSLIKAYQEDPAYAEKKRKSRRAEKLRKEINALEGKLQISEDMQDRINEGRLRKSARNTQSASKEAREKLDDKLAKLKAELEAEEGAPAPLATSQDDIKEAAGQAVGDNNEDPAYVADSSDEEADKADDAKQKPEQLREKLKQQQKEDAESVQKHFAAFLEERELSAARDVQGEEPQFLVPTYVGALNRTVQKNGMLSIMMMLADQARVHYAKGEEKRPLAFVLFTSVINSKDKIPGISEDAYKEGDSGASVCIGAQNGKSQQNWSRESKETPKSAVCFECSFNKVKGNMKMSWKWFFVSSAGAAIDYMHAVAGNKKERPMVAILGYDMLKAGLTIQKSVDNYHYCPRHLALATSEFMPLDAQLQIAGRTFFDFFPAKLRTAVCPSKEEWPIDVLGSEGLVERLKDYSNMEEVLSRAGNSAMYKAVHSSFMASVVQANTRGGQGVVGSRGGAITPLLGFTPYEYARRLKIQVDQKKKRLGKNVGADLDAELQKLESAEANAEMDAGEASKIEQAEKETKQAQLQGAQCGLVAPDVVMKDADAATESAASPV